VSCEGQVFWAVVLCLLGLNRHRSASPHLDQDDNFVPAGQFSALTFPTIIVIFTAWLAETPADASRRRIPE